ncbi:MAG: RdgB/HAM1 family non-canonical purine NTP pyrophosphatase [Verrucomicrobia bacterium]|nr:RdgB/HAM1 family non-canonical purine NTP pyrophosphatase [Verrucomicrobiota bacterium]MBU4290970.1 RdgB/HAM1 family non-canonical purine NTP pyrophosphatase [Verrucomicrobiota bacterium]MBU4429576.1 RdgB/HAM1 family non-canonical purine NTP pyrophosphatase [Verrucomicrobiota bacterium]MCG2679378.1 RdgB/HAM1 family non-canonical purine NTP pyrophosphatase [Kiritimatiellia bacterium]
MKLLIASRNRHKIEEIRAILNLPAVDLADIEAFPNLPEVVEDGHTFQSNAVKKAVTLALMARVWTLADDSGLEVDALTGAPGVQSARYAGEPVNYEANNVKLLEALRDHEVRTARFRCVVALASADGRAQIVDGTCAGKIIHECRGTGGFGYDPLFVPDGYDQTFAEMDPSLKNQLSHRARALKQARELWGELLASAAPSWPSFRKPRPPRA